MTTPDSISLLQATLESTADGILVVSSDGKIISFNSKFLEMWKIPDSVIETRDDDRALEYVLGQLKDPEAFSSKVSELYEKEEAKSFDLLELNDGRIFERYSQPHRTGDIVLGRVWSFRDITERKRAEEALGLRVGFGNIVSSLSTHFINLASDEIDQGINYALKTIGEFADVDRSYLFLFNDGGKTIDNSHEWCAQGIEPQIGRLVDVPVDNFPWITGKIERGEVIHIPRVSDMPPEADAEKQEIQAQQVLSLIIVPMSFRGTPIGFVGFDSVLSEKTWSEDTIELLKIVGEMFANALERKQSESALKDSFSKLSKKNRYDTIKSAVGRSIHQTINKQDVLNNAVNTIFENMDQADMVEIYQIKEDEAVLMAFKGYKDDYLERATRIPYPKGFIWKTAIEGEDIYCADADKDTAIGPAGRESGIKSYLSMPIRYDGEITGVIGINSMKKDSFNEEEQSLLNTVRFQLEIAIKNAKQAQALEEALTEVECLKNQLEAENIYLKEELRTQHNFEEIIGESDALKNVLHKVELVAPTDATVLIHGETGTGKELFARAVHGLSDRRDRSLIKVNCGAISEGLVESELFGHEKGAFTGAVSSRQGRFELADGGTIFLDEVGELSQGTQVKLLRALQEGEIERVGGTETIKVDVRVIAATNKDLKELVDLGEFRSDLYYRLHVFPVLIPPLRERDQDVRLLINHFVGKYSTDLRKDIQKIPKKTLNFLLSYDWPGNVRELQNVIERAVIVAEESTIRISDLPGIKLEKDFQGPSPNSMQNMERNHIITVLEETNWNISGKNGAASVLEINPSTLRSRMKKLGIKKPVSNPH